MSALRAQTKNKRLIGKLILIVIGMFGFGYALVPLYDIFCNLTGLNGKFDAVAASETQYEVDPNREVTIEFITTVNEQTPLDFEGDVSKMKVIPGKFYTANFWAKNLTSENLVGRAVASVAPGLATQYLKKTECFCFSEQKFEAGEKKIMPVRFVLDPELPKQYKTVTLAYTFFDVSDKQLKK